MGMIMKILNTIWNFFEELAVARAAGILARQGFKKEAIALMNQR
jgi:hypothetical protein